MDFLILFLDKKIVVVTTEGYNYTVMNDDVYLYTGITSVVADESNIGFILTNLRTKETNFYSVPGAEEFSAMNSAKGQVQEKNFTATFPLLVNINDKATYFVSLKDNAGLVKMFAFVDVADYQKVVVTDASRGIDEAIKNYIGKDEVINDNLIEKNITVMDVKSSIIDGTMFYYIKDFDDLTYKVSIKTNEAILPFVSVNDVLKVKYIDGSIKNITSITK